MMTQAPTTHVHRPKVEYFNLADLTNTDPKGFVRPVQRYDVKPWGLYMARTSDHPRFHYIESWIIPEFGMRATVFHFHPRHKEDQDYYIDIGEYTVAKPKVWKSVDHYLDIIVRTGRSTDLLDADELLEAHAAGLIDTAQATRAMKQAAAVIDGIASHDYHLEDWLATKQIQLSWM